MLHRVAVTALLLVAFTRVAVADPDPGWQPRVTAAIAGGVHSTTEAPLLAQFDAPNATGGFVDGEVGARFGQLGLVGFGRWARYYDPFIYPDGPSTTPNYSAHVDDYYVGARAHYWPSRWFRMSFAIGEAIHRERDRDVGVLTQGEVSMDGTLRLHRLFWQTQFAVPVVHVQRWQVEVGVDIGSAPTDGFELALGLGIRM